MRSSSGEGAATISTDAAPTSTTEDLLAELEVRRSQLDAIYRRTSFNNATHFDDGSGTDSGLGALGRQANGKPESRRPHRSTRVHPIEAGELVALDTDAIGCHRYNADLSRTFLAGDPAPTPRQRELYSMAPAGWTTRRSQSGGGAYAESSPQLRGRPAEGHGQLHAERAST